MIALEIMAFDLRKIENF